MAIKVVQHGRGTRGLTAQQRMDRESLLSTSLSHPNIVTTYKITPVQSSSRPSTSTRSPDQTPLENDGHQGPGPERPAAGPERPAVGLGRPAAGPPEANGNGSSTESS